MDMTSEEWSDCRGVTPPEGWNIRMNGGPPRQEVRSRWQFVEECRVWQEESWKYAKWIQHQSPAQILIFFRSSGFRQELDGEH